MRQIGSLSARVLNRLQALELHEVQPQFQTSYRQAWIKVSLATEGHAKPFAEATRRVWGCYPDQVWPRLVAENQTRCGPLYSTFYDENDNWRSQENLAALMRLAEPLPPKKPAESVRFTEEQIRRRAGKERVADSEKPTARVVVPAPPYTENQPLTATPAKSMAATAQTAYRNSGEHERKNPPMRLPLRVESSRIPSRYRESLKHFVQASQEGPQLWASTFRAAFGRGVSYRTMQRHIDWLERERILKKKHAANELFVPGQGIRRTATYVIHEEAGRYLAPRETYEQWASRNHRTSPKRTSPHRDTRRAPVPVPAPEPPKAAPQPAEETQHRSARSAREPIARALTPRQGKALVNRVAELMTGVVGKVYVPGGGYRLVDPGDRDYRAPMSREKALVSACMSEGIRLQDGEVHLKQCGFDFAEWKRVNGFDEEHSP